MKRTLATLLAAVSFPCAALTGNEIWHFHQAGNSIGVSAYVMGTVDGLTLQRVRFGKTAEDVGYCLPEDGNYQQVIDLTIRYLDKHPESRHLPAASLVLSAVTEAWPCGK